MVDGHEALAGNDGNQVRAQSGRRRPAASSRTRHGARARQIGCTSRSISRLAPTDIEKNHVFAAITEDGLTSVVKRGENSGRTLHHVAVARTVERSIPCGEGSRADGQLQIRRDGANGLKAVVWLQGGKLSPDVRSRDHVDNDRGRIKALRARRQLVLPPLFLRDTAPCRPKLCVQGGGAARYQLRRVVSPGAGTMR